MTDPTPEPMSEEGGDWYCRNCGYLSAARVTNSETCDTCHFPVEWHTVNEVREIDRLRARVVELERALESVKCVTCRGTGKIRTACSMCGDSTYDHYCDDHDVECYQCGGTGYPKSIASIAAAIRARGQREA